MVTDFYVFRHSIVHRVRPLVKIGALLLLCTGLFIVEGWLAVAVAGSMILCGFVMAGLKPRHAFASLRPLFWILVSITVVQVYLTDLSSAGFVIARLVVLALAAALVNLTTKTSEFIEGIMAALKYAPIWVPKEQIALAISLCLRFIPQMRCVINDIRQAQHAWGLERNLTNFADRSADPNSQDC